MSQFAQIGAQVGRSVLDWFAPGAAALTSPESIRAMLTGFGAWREQLAQQRQLATDIAYKIVRDDAWRKSLTPAAQRAIVEFGKRLDRLTALERKIVPALQTAGSWAAKRGLVSTSALQSAGLAGGLGAIPLLLVGAIAAGIVAVGATWVVTEWVQSAPDRAQAASEAAQLAKLVDARIAAGNLDVPSTLSDRQPAQGAFASIAQMLPWLVIGGAALFVLRRRGGRK